MNDQFLSKKKQNKKKNLKNINSHLKYNTQIEQFAYVQ